jgi:hypothetical protein
MPKGEKLRPKQMDQLPLENFEKSRSRILICSKYTYCKIWSLMGRIYDYGKKGGVFGTRSFFQLDYLSLCPNM